MALDAKKVYLFLASGVEFYSKKQYVAHGRFESCEYPNNSLSLYDYLINEGFKIVECDVMFTKDNVPVLCHDDNLLNFAKDDFGNSVNIKIDSIDFSEIIKYNFSITDKRTIKVTTLEELLSLCKENSICIELDLEKKFLGRRKYKILYELVKRYQMLNMVIWEVSPSDFYSISSIDNSLIYQIDHTWSFAKLDELKKKKKVASLIISSEWFPGFVDKDYKAIIEYGKSLGFIMKCATINEKSEADKMFCQGVDLITTDKLNMNSNKKNRILMDSEITKKSGKKVLTVGVYDMIHIGHVNLFKRAQALGDSLTVAVQKSEVVLKYKPQAKLVYSTEERMYMVKSIRFVDDVITYEGVDEIVKVADFDIFVTGPDQIHSGFQDAIKWCKNHGKEHVVLGRTEGISSSWLKEQIKQM